MLLSLLFNSPFAFLLLAAVLTLALTVHEFAHAIVADRLGDPTPRSQGRVTLNPLAHLDPLGTLALLIAGFGWGKPVMVDAYNLRSPRRDMLLVAAAGPLSNIIMATIATLLLVFVPFLHNSLAQTIFSAFIHINLGLAAFNLIPIHPLDGGKILSGILPPSLAAEFDDVLYQYGNIILLALIFPWAGGRSGVSYLMEPIATALEIGLFALVNGVGLLFGAGFGR